MNTSSLKSQLKALISGDLPAGIDLFEKSLADQSKLFNEVILLKSRYEQIELDANRDGISFEQKNLVLNKIRITYLSLVDQIKEEDLKTQAGQSIPEQAPAVVDPRIYQMNCMEFLQSFLTGQHRFQEQFSAAYDQLGQLQIDFGQTFVSVGKVIESTKMEAGKEEEFHARLKVAIGKSARRLNLFESKLQPAIEQAAGVNQRLLQHYQQLIHYLDHPNPSLRATDCQESMKKQLQQLDLLKSKSEKFLESLSFTGQLESMAYAFRIDEQLEVAFRTVLDSMKELKANTERLCRQAGIFSMELGLSIEEMSI